MDVIGDGEKNLKTNEIMDVTQTEKEDWAIQIYCGG